MPDWGWPYWERADVAPPPLHVWSHEALGAPSFIKLRNLSATKTQGLFASAALEISRLDNIFSLSNKTSEISKLNQNGKLTHASRELIDVLKAAQKISSLTNGAFDITVQSLWNTANFLTKAKMSEKAKQQLWAKAYDLVNYQYVVINANSVSFTKPDVAVTLNGLAQGYITDKITQHLLDKGASAGLVNIGEFRAFGSKTWKIGIQNPHNIMDILEVIRLQNASLATSSAKGGYLSAELSHIFGPRTGYEKPQFISASVVHKSAMMADGLATAFTLLDVETIRAIAQKSGVKLVLLVRKSGKIIRI